MAEDSGVKVSLVYPHHLGDRVELFGVVWAREGEKHYAMVSKADADRLVAEKSAELVNA